MHGLSVTFVHGVPLGDYDGPDPDGRHRTKNSFRNHSKHMN
jgi:hypothetical protein